MADAKTSTILLTGVTGFIAKRIAHDLLAQGYNVRGSLRSPNRAAEVRAALNVEETDTRLTFVELDLSSDTGWSEAMSGIDALIHTASPFPMAMPKDENDLIRPAVDGTLRALRAAQEAGVQRIILTSSVVAIMHADRPAGTLAGPDDWTDINHPTASAYVKSKTLAERAAWDFAKEHPQIALTAVNPGLVVGEPLDAHYGTSLNVIERILLGGDPAVPEIGFPIVDVADVSRLHVEALDLLDTAGKRIVAAGDYATMPEISRLLKSEFPDRKIATRIAPKLLLRLLGLFDPAIKMILPQVGFFTPMNNEETKALYGMEFTPMKEAVLASARYVLATKG
ncbi:MAG: NAD-dependent epimerase/dehydratase family protein [Pseudomonadota bacterium]